MNGNGTTEESPPAPAAPGPPDWMHDFLPQSVVLDCQGPECDQSARAYWVQGSGWVALGWHTLDAQPYCSWLCVARYAAPRAQDDFDTLQAAAPAPGARIKRTRHN